jgi:nitrogen regulatory protein PII
MNIEPEMTIVTALIRPQMEGRVVQALHELPDFPGFFLVEARGQGRGRGAGGSYQANEFDLTYHRYLQPEIVCRSGLATDICDLIAGAAWTGRKGDGVIFTTDAHSFVRIREVGGPKDEVSR